MKSKQNIRILILALLLAGAAALATYYFISGLGAASKKTVPVLMAAQDISANTVMNVEMVTVREIPEAYAHPQALRSPDQIVGKISKVQLLAGEQILVTKVAGKEHPGNRFSYRIPSDERAITLAVSETTGIAGFPTVGDRVDILLTKTGKDDDVTVTSTLLQNKEILATGSVTLPQEDGVQRIVPSITLSVTPGEAQILTLAESTGSIKLSLRAPVDNTVVPLQPASSR